MTTCTLPDFLKRGAPEIGLPRLTTGARLRGIIGTALPDLPPLPDRTSHDPRSADAHAALAWLWHVREGRMG